MEHRTASAATTTDAGAVAPATASPEPTLAESTDGSKGDTGGGFDPPSPVTLECPPDTSPPNAFGMLIWAATMLVTVISGAANVIRGEVFYGLVLLICAGFSFTYVGQWHRFRLAVEAWQKRPPPTKAVEQPMVVAAAPNPTPPVAAPHAPIKSELVVEAVEVPVVVVPTPKPLAPPRWLIICRADGFNWSLPVPDLPLDRGWWFRWGGFYVRRDAQGFYACVGHPDDPPNLDTQRRLFEEAAVKVGDYALTVTATPPTVLN